MSEPDHLVVQQCLRVVAHEPHAWESGSGMTYAARWCNGIKARVGRPSKSTPWWKIVRRIVYARQRNLPVRVQVFIDGSWRYAGQRR